MYLLGFPTEMGVVVQLTVSHLASKLKKVFLHAAFWVNSTEEYLLGKKKKSDRCSPSLLTFVPLRNVLTHGLCKCISVLTWNCNCTKLSGMVEIGPKNSKIIFSTG